VAIEEAMTRFAAAEAFPPVLVYHKIDVGWELGVNIVSPRAFRAQMEWLASRGYDGITLRDAVRAAYRGEALGRAVVLTFDDGYAGIARHAAPVLEDLGFRATVFVPSGYVGSVNTWDTALLGRRYRHLDRGELRALARAGFEIGSHSATHPDLRRSSAARLVEETAGSRSALESTSKSEVTSFSYPFGRCDARVRDAVRRAGFSAACGDGPGRTEDPFDAFLIPRSGVRAVDGVGALARKIAGPSALERLKDAVAHVAAGGTAWTKSRLPFVP
jgi:peptidoglycan/xylan/chitin deacetylase (PgdA/CDA1 family)